MIEINVKNRVCTLLEPAEPYICGNTDTQVRFIFDEGWPYGLTKTARFEWDGNYQDVVLQPDLETAYIPRIDDATKIKVGVFAGNLKTTTPAVIKCVPSIITENGAPADPTPDVYSQLMGRLNEFEQEIDAKPSQEYVDQEVARVEGELPDLELYATKEWTEEQGYLKEHQSLDGYATEEWVNDQGYLTEHQDISGKVNKPAQEGTAGQVLSTNGDGTTQWKDAGGGGGESNTLVVAFESEDGEEYTCNKTYSEIEEAYNSGKGIVGMDKYKTQSLTFFWDWDGFVFEAVNCLMFSGRQATGGNATQIKIGEDNAITAVNGWFDFKTS